MTGPRCIRPRIEPQEKGSEVRRAHIECRGENAWEKSRRVIADANHVFKRETRDPGSLTPVQIASTYADDGHPLADGLVESIVTFVQTPHD